MSYNDINDFLIESKIPEGECPRKWVKNRFVLAKKEFGKKALMDWINKKREERFIIWEIMELEKLAKELNGD